MKFSVSSRLSYQAFGVSTVICSLSCQKSGGQRIIDESLTTTDGVARTDLSVGLEANRLVRLDVAAPGYLNVQYQATVETAAQSIATSRIRAVNSSAFEAVALPYLHPSRYAPADRTRAIAYDLFGAIGSPLAQALAVEDWLYQHISYLIGASNEQSSSLDTFETRSGVCRDFAHLGIAFCRALNLPARYVTVYAYNLLPQDFHAVFEVYIDGTWYLFDGTRKAPLNGMVRIATGRDASETAVGNLFGNIRGQNVQAGILIAPDERELFTPITRESLRREDKVLYLA